MTSQKLSISLSSQLYSFLEKYRLEHHYKTRSEVIKDALNLLQQAQLEANYREANKEITDEFDKTSGDGIQDDETW